MRPLLTTIAVFTALIAGSLQSEPAQAATVNVLQRDCAKYTTSCVYAPPTFDSVGRSLAFRSSTGATVTVRTAASAWRYVKAHSVKCATPNSTGCYQTDTVTHRKVITFRDGLNVAVSFFH